MMHQDALSFADHVTLNRCQASSPVSVVTEVAPLKKQQFFYLAAADCIYAVNAGDGTTRWCQQIKLTRKWSYHPGVSSPPPPRMTFGAMQVANSSVYVCASGFGEYTCAFTASSGDLRWRTSTDGRARSMPFADSALPLVEDGIVYSGTYALSEESGAVLWRLSIDTQAEGTLSLHALVDHTMYATTHEGLYAINTQSGEICWLYQADRNTHTFVSGPPVVSDHLLYIGTGGSVAHPEQSYFCALEVRTGRDVWRYPMGRYLGAVVSNDHIYVSSEDGYLYALDKHSGHIIWRYQFATPGHSFTVIEHDILYASRDGLYALDSKDGRVLWHQSLQSGRGVFFTSPVVLDGIVYLAKIDGRGKSVLHALNASNGFEYWHTSYPAALAPLTIGR